MKISKQEQQIIFDLVFLKVRKFDFKNNVFLEIEKKNKEKLKYKIREKNKINLCYFLCKVKMYEILETIENNQIELKRIEIENYLEEFGIYKNKIRFTNDKNIFKNYKIFDNEVVIEKGQENIQKYTDDLRKLNSVNIIFKN